MKIPISSKMIVFLLLTIILAIGYSNHYSLGERRRYFDNCLYSIGNIVDLQRAYYREFGEYIEGYAELQAFSNHMCASGKKRYCGLEINAGIKNYFCDIRMTTRSRLEYRIEGNTKNGRSCYICANIFGVNRTHNWECDDKNKNVCLSQNAGASNH